MCVSEPLLGERYCERHKPMAEAKYKAYSALYEQDRRVFDERYRAFYQSREWRQLRAEVLSERPFCVSCKRAFASDCHHKIPLKDDWSKRLDKGNIDPLCRQCHSKLELTERNKREKH